MSKEIWIADDDQSIVWIIEKALSKHGFSVRAFSDGEHLVYALSDQFPDLIISDIQMPKLGGFDLLSKINKIRPELPVIIMTAFGDLDSAVDSFKFGAFEYLTKPFDIDELISLVSRGLVTTSVNDSENLDIKRTQNTLLGESLSMQEVFRIIGRIAPSNLGVLIRGESGTGKELVANAIHQSSTRSHLPMVAINTAAIPSELLESELFGHEKGAFTGAHARHIGRFEQANNATLFLDEIGDMPLALQSRLLRVLSEGRFFRVGGREEMTVDVRIIAATNQNLESQVETGQFRNDLFHRLNVMSIQVPPLRKRSEDIPQLVKHFLKQIALGDSAKGKKLEEGVMSELQRYPWPGNVRELQNVIQQLSILSIGSEIQLSDLPPLNNAGGSIIQSTNWQSLLEKEVTRRIRIGEKSLAKSINMELENVLIQAAMEYSGGHIQNAAKLLGWGRNTLSRKKIIQKGVKSKKF